MHNCTVSACIVSISWPFLSGPCTCNWICIWCSPPGNHGPKKKRATSIMVGLSYTGLGGTTWRGWADNLTLEIQQSWHWQHIFGEGGWLERNHNFAVFFKYRKDLPLHYLPTTHLLFERLEHQTRPMINKAVLTNRYWLVRQSPTLLQLPETKPGWICFIFLRFNTTILPSFHSSLLPHPLLVTISENLPEPSFTWKHSLPTGMRWTQSFQLVIDWCPHVTTSKLITPS